MRPVRLNLFTVGDCTKIGTWSGLPYFFYHALLDSGVEVTPIDLVPSTTAGYKELCRFSELRGRIAKRIRPDSRHELFRSKPYHVLANRQLRKNLLNRPGADLNLFLTFTFSSYRYAGIPVAHYCDRTFEHYLEEIGKKPSRAEQASMRIDQENIENADLVLTTNQSCFDFIEKRYKPKRLVRIGGGVNRHTDPTNANVADLIREKGTSTDILFIGRGVYKRGADILIQAFQLFNDRHSGRFTLHVVGVEPGELPRQILSSDRNITFYGYLDRAIPSELETYNALLRSARMFVLPMRLGPPPGVVREVQSLCTPVIMSNIPDSLDCISHDRNGVLVDGVGPEAYADSMENLVSDPDRWRRLAETAQSTARTCTWTQTVENFLEIAYQCRLIDQPVSHSRLSALSSQPHSEVL